MGAAAVQRAAQGRLHLGPRHAGRQGQRHRRPDGDPDAAPARRGDGPGHHLPGRGRRGGHAAVGHHLHDREPLGQDRGGVRHRRGRHQPARGRGSEGGRHTDHGEDAAEGQTRRTRHRRSRLDAAYGQRHHHAGRGGGEGGQLGDADPAERDHARLFPPHGGADRRRDVLALRQRREPGVPGRDRRLVPRERPLSLLGAAQLRRADHRGRRLPPQRDPVRGRGHAGYPHAAGRGRGRLLRQARRAHRQPGHRDRARGDLPPGGGSVGHRQRDVPGDRGRGPAPVPRLHHAAGDGHRRHGYVPAAREGGAGLRHRTCAHAGGDQQPLRRPQRQRARLRGVAAGDGALPVGDRDGDRRGGAVRAWRRP